MSLPILPLVRVAITLFGLAVVGPFAVEAEGHHQHGEPPARLLADDCGHCADPGCAAGFQCEAGPGPALGPGAERLAVKAPERLGTGWLPDRPLSANPTPPTPPPLSTS